MPKRKVEPVLAGIPTSFDSPESSSIERAEYDPGSQSMVVWFHRPSGETQAYDHDGIPLSLWAEFYQADSKGSFYNRFVRPLYTGRSRG